MVAQINRHFIRTRPWKIWPRLLAYSLFEGRPLTTRGRWINPVVFAGYQLWNLWPIHKRADRPVFILGVGRSGTTVLGTILALHPDIGYLNEPKALWHAALGNDDLIGSYCTQTGRFRMTAADATKVATHRLQRYYSAFLGLSASRRVVDKYPELLFRSGLVDAVFPGARKIVLVRNGADICRSIEAWSQRHGDDCADWWGQNRRKWHALVAQLVEPDPFFAPALVEIRDLTRQVDMAAVEWIVTMREAMALQKTDENLKFVRFEHLAARPRETLADILNFCDLKTDQKLLDYAERTLKPRPAYTAPSLSPQVQRLFNVTMDELGYNVGQPA